MVGLSELKSMFLLGVHGRAASVNSGCFEEKHVEKLRGIDQNFGQICE